MNRLFANSRQPRLPRSERSQQFCSGRSGRSGATIVLILILLPILCGLAAFAINLAHIQSVNTEVQIATDAAVKAATRTYALTGDQGQALAAAQLAASHNPIGGTVLPINAGDLEFGIGLRNSLADTYSFTPAAQGNAIRLRTQTLASSNGSLIQPVFPLFGGAVTINPLRTATSTQSTVDISLVVDRSGSMAYASWETVDGVSPPASAAAGWAFGDPVPPNSRWLDLVAAVNSFTAFLDSTADVELVSLSTYSDNTATNIKLTNDYPTIQTALNAISGSFLGGATNVGGGMLEGLAAINDPSLARPYSSRVMVVMTDGNHNTGTNPTSAAHTIAKSGTTIYTVTFSDEANQSLMQNVANIGSGQHFHAVDAVQLNAAFQEIARRIPTLLTE